jgi:hypothetical protein
MRALREFYPLSATFDEPGTRSEVSERSHESSALSSRSAFSKWGLTDMMYLLTHLSLLVQHGQWELAHP